MLQIRIYRAVARPGNTHKLWVIIFISLTRPVSFLPQALMVIDI